MTETPPHVYARIAEEVTRKTGIETDSLEVNAFIHDGYDRETLGKRERAVYDAVIAEARSYGLDVGP